MLLNTFRIAGTKPPATVLQQIRYSAFIVRHHSSQYFHLFFSYDRLHPESPNVSTFREVKDENSYETTEILRSRRRSHTTDQTLLRASSPRILFSVGNFRGGSPPAVQIRTRFPGDGLEAHENGRLSIILLIRSGPRAADEQRNAKEEPDSFSVSR